MRNGVVRSERQIIETKPNWKTPLEYLGHDVDFELFLSRTLVVLINIEVKRNSVFYL